MKDVILEMRDISFSYEDSPFTLRDISFTARQGEKVAVLGQNGAGKSTFFLLLNGVLAPDGGEMLLRGQRVSSSKKDLMRLRERVGYVFQEPDRQIIGSTVEAEVSFGPMNLRLSRDEVAARVDEALAAMQMCDLRQRPPHMLSGGQKKRVSIADVLAMRPEAILFDEPTASLDPAGVAMLEGVLAQLTQAGKTLLVSTHDLDFAWRWADRLLVFAGGRLLADGSPDTVFADDALLEASGLRRPILYDVVCRLRDCGLLEGGKIPRTVDELDCLVRAGRVGV